MPHPLELPKWCVGDECYVWRYDNPNNHPARVPVHDARRARVVLVGCDHSFVQVFYYDREWTGTVKPEELITPEDHARLCLTI